MYVEMVKIKCGGLYGDSEGYIELEELLKHRTFIGKYTKLDIERVVNNDDKKRFKLRLNPLTSRTEIKANQGHTLHISDAELTPILQPIYKTVVHGTYMKCWPLISKQGLSRMQRQHIHLAKGTLDDPTVISGLRRDVQLYIYIDLNKDIAGGIKFYESENGVILTEGNENGYLEPKYFEKVVTVNGEF